MPNFFKKIFAYKDDPKLLIAFLSGLFIAVVFNFIIFSQFYFYQVVILMLFVLPVWTLLFFRHPKETLLASLIILISFNPGVPVMTGQDSSFIFLASDVVLIFTLWYLFIQKVFGNIKSTFPPLSFWKLGLPLLLWFASGAISIIPAVNKIVSYVELIRMFRLLLLFFATFNLVTQRDDLRLICRYLICAFVIQIFLVFAEYILGYPLFRLPGATRELDVVGDIVRPGGTLGHSSNFAKFATLCLPITLAYFNIVTDKRKKGALFFIFLCGLIALMLTVSRAGIICSFCAIILLLGAILKRSKRNKFVIGVLLVVLLSFSLGLGWLLGGQRLSRRLHNDSGSIASRPPMYVVAMNVIRSNWIFGVGISNYTLVAPKYDNTKERISITFPHPVHNIFLLYFAEMGILGLFSFMWFLGGTIRVAASLWKSHINLTDGLLFKAVWVGLIFTWLQGLIGWGFRSSVVHWAYLAILSAAMAAFRYKLKESKYV